MNFVDVLLHQVSLISPHQCLISLWDGAHRFQVNSEKAKREQIRHLHRGVEDSTLDRHGELADFVFETRLMVRRCYRESGEETQFPRRITTVGNGVVTELNSRLKQALLQVLQIAFTPNFTEAQDIRFDGFEDRDDSAFFVLGFIGTFDGFLTVKAVHGQPVFDIVGAEPDGFRCLLTQRVLSAET